MPFFGPLKDRECRIPRSGDTQDEECRMPFIGPLKGACPGLYPQKARRHSFYVYGKIIYMISQKSQVQTPHGGGGLDEN